jgi:hypothetical protein
MGTGRIPHTTTIAHDGTKSALEYKPEDVQKLSEVALAQRI